MSGPRHGPRKPSAPGGYSSAVHYFLFYDYVSDIMERRGPYRPEHLALAGEYREHGKLLMAGAVGDPVEGAAFVFTVDSPAEIEEFIQRDPYVLNDLVTAHRIQPWNVVVGPGIPPAG